MYSDSILSIRFLWIHFTVDTLEKAFIWKLIWMYIKFYAYTNLKFNIPALNDIKGRTHLKCEQKRNVQ